MNLNSNNQKFYKFTAIVFVLSAAAYLIIVALNNTKVDFTQASVTPLIEEPSFPGAEGFGAKSKGGRGGKVVLVTNTNDSGVGSLRQALEVETGPRTIVFTVGGTITLTKPLKLSGANGSYVTIAGQTAPGGGIQIKDYGLQIYNGAHDIILRYLKIRVGQRSNFDFVKDYDSIEMWGDTASVYNIMIDHVSAEWALDENISAYDDVHDVTIQYSIIAESTLDGQEHKTAKGLLVGNDDPDKLPTNFTMHHNVFAHNDQRNPRIAFADTDFRNNIIYNWGADNSSTFGNYQSQLQYLTTATSGLTKVNLVNNIWKKGASSRVSQTNMIWVNKGAQLFVQGNWGTSCPAGCSGNEWSIGVKEEFSPYANALESIYRVSQPFTFPTVTTHTTNSLQSLLLPNVGASLPARDSVDQRIINDVINGTGQTGINGSFPTLAAGTAEQDTDLDGIPDTWEQQRGLNINNNADSLQTAPSGYTWIEEYINWIASPSAEEPTATPTPTTIVATATPTPTIIPTFTPTPTTIAPTATPTPTGILPTATPTPTGLIPTATASPTPTLVLLTATPTVIVPTPTLTPTVILSSPVVITPTTIPTTGNGQLPDTAIGDSPIDKIIIGGLFIFAGVIYFYADRILTLSKNKKFKDKWENIG